MAIQEVSMFTVYVWRESFPEATWAKEIWWAEVGWSVVVDQVYSESFKEFLKYEYMYEDTMYAWRYY